VVERQIGLLQVLFAEQFSALQNSSCGQQTVGHCCCRCGCLCGNLVGDADRRVVNGESWNFDLKETHFSGLFLLARERNFFSL
jgi:hypothetical protein